MQGQADCFVPAFAKQLVGKRPVVGMIGADGFEGELFPVSMETSCQTGESEFGSLRRETTPPSFPLCFKLMVRRQNRVLSAVAQDDRFCESTNREV